MNSYRNGNDQLVILYSSHTETWDFRCKDYAILVDTTDEDSGIGDDLVGQFLGDSGVIEKELFDREFAKRSK